MCQQMGDQLYCRKRSSLLTNVQMFPFQKHSYEKVGLIPARSRSSSPASSHRGGKLDLQPLTGIRNIPLKHLALIIIPSTTLVVLLIFGGIVLSRTWKPTLAQISITAGIPPDYCGTSPAQAKAAGCAFELNNFAWIHPDCYDAELDADWTDGPLAGDLEFWEQYGGIGHIPKELVMTGEVQMVWVNTRQHRRHCLFIWEKYQRAAMDQRPMDNFTADYKHTKHCIKLLRNVDLQFPDEEVSSFLTLKYPTCEFGPIQLAITETQ